MIGRISAWMATFLFQKALDSYNQHNYQKALRFFKLAGWACKEIKTDACFATYRGFTYFKLSQLSIAIPELEKALFLLRRAKDRTLAEALTRNPVEVTKAKDGYLGNSNKNDDSHLKSNP